MCIPPPQVAHLQAEIRAAAAATAALATPSPPPPRVVDHTARGRGEETPRVLELALRRATGEERPESPAGLVEAPVASAGRTVEQSVARELFGRGGEAQAEMASPSHRWGGASPAEEEDDMCRVEGPSPLPTAAAGVVVVDLDMTPEVCGRRRVGRHHAAGTHDPA
jgi:hypothetical protein